MTTSEMKGRNVIVTGALGGLGSWLTHSFLSAGARVYAIDIEDHFGRSSKDMPISNDMVEYFQLNVANYIQVKKFFSEKRDVFKNVFCLVNNVGIPGPRGEIDKLECEALSELFETNILSMFYMCQHVVPIMKAAGTGRIVNISSAAGLMGYAGRSAYSSSKWAVSGFTKSLAIELGPSGITVNAVAPGALQGDALDRAIVRIAEQRKISLAEARENFLEQSSLRQIVDPKAVAEYTVFLCGDSAKFITAQIIPIDAGTTQLK